MTLSFVKTILAAVAAVMVAPLVGGCGRLRPEGIDVRSVFYDSDRGRLQVEASVVSPADGRVIPGLDESAFAVTVGDDHLKPSVVGTRDRYRVEFDVPPRSSVPAFEIEAEAGGRTYSGEYQAPARAVRYVFQFVLASMVAFSALVVAKFGYLVVRRSRPPVKAASRAPAGGSSSKPRVTREEASSAVRVRLRSVGGSRSPIDVLVRSTSIVGREDRNFQLPFVEIPGEGLHAAHAEIQLAGASAFVLNFAGGTVKVDGVPVGSGQKCRLTQGCRLKLGLVDFDVELVEASET